MKRLLLPLLAALALPTAVNAAFTQKEEDPLTDKKSLMITEQSTNKVKNSIGVPQKGLFAIGCFDMKGENTYRIIFRTPTFNSSDNQDILVRFDKKEAENWSMYGQNGGTGFELPASKRQEFLNNIVNHSKLALQWKDYPNLVKHYLIFDLSELKEEIYKAKEEGCSFKI